MRKKLLPSPILLLLILSVFSALNVNITRVSAGVSPYIAVVPEIPLVDLTPGTNFTVSIYTDCIGGPKDILKIGDITAYQFTLYYNPSVLHGIEVVNGDLITAEEHPTHYPPGMEVCSARFSAGTFDNTEGKLSLTVGYFKEVEWTAGPGTLANVTFTVWGEGASTITIGPETRLYGWDYLEWEPYYIIDAATMPTHIQHGYFQNVPTVTHDINVTSVTPSPTSVINGTSVDITVDVKNEGNVNEAFNVTAYANNTAIEKKNVVNLGSNVTKSLTFAWDTTGWDLGTYTISAEAVVAADDYPNNNLFTDGTVIVFKPVHPPVAVITAEETVAYANVTMIFDGEGSYDPDLYTPDIPGGIVAFDWDFGDETTATGEIVTHAYTTIGLYEVTLVVTDSQNQVSDPSDPSANLLIEIEEYPPEPPAYSAALVKWKAKPEAHNWHNSTDLDGLLTLTALATNLGTNAVNVTITFDIYGAHGGEWVYTDSVDTTLEVSVGDVPVSVDIPPESCGFTGTKLVLDAFVTLWYDSSGDGTPDTVASTKITHFAIWA